MYKSDEIEKTTQLTLILGHALDSCEDPSRMLACAELQVPDSLPCASPKSAVLNRDVEGRANEGGFDVRLVISISKRTIQAGMKDGNMKR